MNQSEFAKLRVGDRVRVRSDLVGGERYGGITLQPIIMARFRGNDYKIEGKSNHTVYLSDKRFCCGYYFSFEMLEPVSTPEIVITTDGRETKARLYEGEELKKTATALCHPDDEFDFAIGAKIAYDRLMGVCEGKSEDCLHLICKFLNRDCGIIGAPTKYKDSLGQPLFVGDVVSKYKNGEFVRDSAVVESCLPSKGYINKQYISGIESSCDDCDGTVGDGWKLLKKTPYTELRKGDIVCDSIKVC